jgi:hypothetical protein
MAKRRVAKEPQKAIVKTARPLLNEPPAKVWKRSVANLSAITNGVVNQNVSLNSLSS